jgi:hypothetical protein
MSDGPFMLPDGRALDDAEPQDIARAVAALMDRLAEDIGSGEQSTEAQREERTLLLGRAAALMRQWATFGTWPPRRCPHCGKSTLSRPASPPPGAER